MYSFQCVKTANVKRKLRMFHFSPTFSEVCSLNAFKEVQELLKQEQERNAQLETQISVLISDLRSYENLLAQVISGGSKVRIVVLYLFQKIA